MASSPPSSSAPSNGVSYKDGRSQRVSSVRMCPAPGSALPDDWRSERSRAPQSRAGESDRRSSKNSRQSTSENRGPYVLTVNTGSRYQPPNARDRSRFTIPRTGGSIYCSSNHSRRGSPRRLVGGVSGSASSSGNKERSAKMDWIRSVYVLR